MIVSSCENRVYDLAMSVPRRLESSSVNERMERVRTKLQGAFMRREIYIQYMRLMRHQVPIEQHLPMMAAFVTRRLLELGCDLYGIEPTVSIGRDGVVVDVRAEHHS